MHFPEEIAQNVFPVSFSLKVHLIYKTCFQCMLIFNLGGEIRDKFFVAPAFELGEHAFEVTCI